MKLNYNLQGAERKALVEAASNILGWTPVYKKAPTFAYAIANYIIDKNGVLTGPDSLDLEDALHQAGFDAESREYDETDTYESGLDDTGAIDTCPDIDQHHPGKYAKTETTEEMIQQAEAWMEGQPEFEDLKMTEREELGLGQERRDPWGEDGMQESDCPEPDKRDLPRLYTLDTPRGEIYIAEEFATHDEAAAEGYGEYFSTALGTIYSYGDDHTFALVTSQKAGDWDTTKIKRDFRESAAETAAPKRKRIMDTIVEALNEDAGEGVHWERTHSTPQMECGDGRWRNLDGTYAAQSHSSPEPDGDTLMIEVPLEGFTPEKLANLTAMVAAKAPLLKAALGTDEVPVVMTGDTLRFPWFSRIDADHTDAYATLVSHMCSAAQHKVRVTAKEREFTNPKYAFRCWLLSLGFIGNGFKTARRVLLERLEGNGSWLNGRPGEAEEEAVTTE